MKKLTFLLAAALMGSPSAFADIFAGVTTDNNLITFDSAAPDVSLSTVPVTGLAGGDSLVNLTFNPSTGLFYGLDSAANFYSLTGGGAATQIPTTGFAPAGFSGALAYDPTGGNLVFTSEFGELFTLGTDGAGAQLTDFAYDAGDVNAGDLPVLTGAAFDPDFGTPYFVDYMNDTLATNPDINLGTVSTIGPLGVDTTSFTALAVDSLGGIYASLSTDGTNSGFYSIDPATGTATLITALPVGLSAISSVPEPSAGLLGLLSLGLLLRRRRA